MRNPWIPLLVCLLLLTACSDSDNPTSVGQLPRSTLLTQTWADGELSAIAHDADTDALFFIEDVHSGENVVHRWSFADETLREVYRSTSQHDYGMRVLDGELWIARTYDKAFLRLGDLDQDTLTELGDYVFPGPTSKATEVNDIAALQGNILFVSGNPLGSEQHDGIQVLLGPAFTSIDELLSEAEAGWDVPTHGFFRAIVAVGSGATALVAVTTGPDDGDLVVYDLQGNEQFRAAGLGSSYLQKDSQDRVYAFDLSNGSVVRFSPDFQAREDIETRLPTHRYRFALRETSTHVEFVYAKFRSEESKVNRVLLPK